MATTSGTELGSAAALNRRIIYVLCGLTVVLCVVAGTLLLREPGSPESSPPKAENPPPPGGAESIPERPNSGTPDGGAEVSVVDPTVSDPKIAALRKAHGFFDAGIAHLRLSMSGTPGTKEAEEEKILALENLLEARTCYDAYLEKYPQEERSLDRRMTDLTSQIYWCRKTMAATSFPTTGEESSSREPSPSPQSSRPTERRPEVPRVRPLPTFRPEVAVAKFKAGAARALKDGRPDRIIELGAPLIDDPRMEGRLGDIPRHVSLARAMQAVLTAVEEGLKAKVGGEVELALRDRIVFGLLRAVDEGIIVQAADGVETIRVSSLSAGEIVTRASAAGALSQPSERLAAGAYLVLRGDHEEGARQLILARGGGEDVTSYSHFIDRALRESPELRALSDWVDLKPSLKQPDADLYAALDSFKSLHRQSDVFLEHRLEIFKALGAAGKALEFQLADLYHVLKRDPGKSVKLQYEFEDGDELLDFGTRGDWTVVDGALTGTKGEAWLERFDLKNTDLNFVLRSAADINLVLWEGGWDLRGGLNLNLKVDPAGLLVTFHNGRRRLGREVIRMPREEVEVHLQLKGDKFQVAVNRKVVLKGGGAERTPEKSARIVAFTVKSGPVQIDEVELKTDLDLEWAKAGGTHHAFWIRDYHVTGPFTLSKWNLQVAVEKVEWPEIEPFDEGRTNDDDQPVWRYIRPDQGRLDLNAACRPNDKVFAYAIVRVWSPDRRTAILEVQADDAARAWLNDNLALEMVPLGQPRRVNVKLVPGDNHLLIKVADERSAFWLRARLLTKSGERMPDVICW